jgi:hypothetical protein
MTPPPSVVQLTPPSGLLPGARAALDRARLGVRWARRQAIDIGEWGSVNAYAVEMLRAPAVTLVRSPAAVYRAEAVTHTSTLTDEKDTEVYPDFAPFSEEEILALIAAGPQ